MMNKIFDKLLPYSLIILGLFLGVIGERIPAVVGILLGILGLNLGIKKYLPYLIIFLGLFLLGFMGQIYPAAACIIWGMLLLLEKIWPEKKKADKKDII